MISPKRMMISMTHKYPPSENLFCTRYNMCKKHIRKAKLMDRWSDENYRAMEAPAQRFLILTAKATLKLSDYGAFVKGEMSKIEARHVLERAGWSEQNIANLEG